MFMLCVLFFKVHSGHLFHFNSGLQLFVFCGFTKTEENPQLFPNGFSYGFVAGANVKYCYGPLVAFALRRDLQGEMPVRNWWMICTSWQQLGYPKVKTKTGKGRT